jgi:hypothetical protein
MPCQTQSCPKPSDSRPSQNAAVQSNSPVTDCKVPDIIGGPPDSGTGIKQTMDILKNSRLVLDVYPMTTELDTGISLFRLKSDWDGYIKVLEQCGIAKPSGTQGYVRIACQAESYPTDTFQNDYGDHFLSNIMDVGGSGFTQLSQMGGRRGEGLEVGKDITKMLSAAGEGEGFGNKILRGIGNAGTYGLNKTDEVIDKVAGMGPRAASIANAMRSLLGGARIDFPMIWKNSTYNPVFSITVRLYNPNPAEDVSTSNHIKAPLGALLALGLPQAKDGGDDSFGFYWPFFVRVKCKGVFEIKMGAIQSISVIKGGDQGCVSFNQRLGIVDVRMDFINLHNVMLAMSSKVEERPTLKGYLENIMDKETITPLTRGERDKEEKEKESAPKTTQFSVGAMQSTVGNDTTAPVPYRTSQSENDTVTGLIAGTPPGFITGG